MNDQQLHHHLRDSGRAELAPESTQKIRATVVAEFHRVTSQPTQRFIEQKGIYRLIPKPMIPAAIVSVILAITLGTSAAANAAKPGDFLFGWDQATEQVRRVLTISDEAQARYIAAIAEERFQEQLELEKEKSEHAAEANAKAGNALNEAMIRVADIRLKLESRPGKGAESLTKVEARLRALKGRQEVSNDQLEAQAETDGTRTKIHVAYQRSRWEWTTTVTSRVAIIQEITQRTGIPADQIGAVLQYEISGGDDEGDDETENRNTNTSVNSNTNRNSNRNTNSDDDRDDDDNRNTNVSQPSNTNSGQDDDNDNMNTNSDRDDEEAVTVIRVRVDLGDGETEIKTRIDGREQEWKLDETTQIAILTSISAKTGLTSAAITAIWDYAQE